MHIAPPIRVNRASVLTLWATVVAERLGYPPETALKLGRFVAGSSARAKARRLGIMEEAQEAAERNAAAAGLKPRVQTVRLLGRDIPVLSAADGTLREENGSKPASAKSVQSYIGRAFGDSNSKFDYRSIFSLVRLRFSWVECGTQERLSSRRSDGGVGDRAEQVVPVLESHIGGDRPQVLKE
jgi:hypothetical protein